MPRRALLYGLAAALAGCGGGGTPVPPAGPADLAAVSSPDLATAPPPPPPDLLVLADLAMAPAPDLAMAAYPAGPYGANVGNTFPKLAWVGYVNTTGDAVSTTKPYGAYSAEDLFRSGRPYALVHISEFFWPGCQNAARDLAANGKTLLDAGGAVVEILETYTFGAVSKANLDAWTNNYKIPVTVVKDPDGAGTPTYNALGIRETVFELDLKTMKILKVIHGSIAGQGASAVAQATADLLKLLGK